MNTVIDIQLKCNNRRCREVLRTIMTTSRETYQIMAM